MKKVTLAFISTLSIIIGSYFYAWWFSLGKYQKAEHWLKNIHEIKTYRASTLNSPKLIIAGGSNGLLGINSKLLSNETGLPAVNLAGHAGMSFNFQGEQALHSAQDGDIVIMPLEYSYYSQTSTKTDVDIKNMESWGHEYIKGSSIKEKYNYFRHSTLSSLVSRIATDTQLPVDPIEIALTHSNQTKSTEIIDWVGYNYKSMNFLGDILSDNPPTPLIASIAEKGEKYLDTPTPTSQFIEDAKRLSAALEDKGASLYFTWPTSMKNKLFNMNSKPDLDQALTLKNNLIRLGFNYICSPADFNFPPENFFDTRYHLNFKGALLRTLNLATCLNDAEIGNREPRAGDNSIIAEKLYSSLKHTRMVQSATPANSTFTQNLNN